MSPPYVRPVHQPVRHPHTSDLYVNPHTSPPYVRPVRQTVHRTCTSNHTSPHMLDLYVTSIPQPVCHPVRHPRTSSHTSPPSVRPGRQTGRRTCTSNRPSDPYIKPYVTPYVKPYVTPVRQTIRHPRTSNHTSPPYVGPGRQTVGQSWTLSLRSASYKKLKEAKNSSTVLSASSNLFVSVNKPSQIRCPPHRGTRLGDIYDLLHDKGFKKRL